MVLATSVYLFHVTSSTLLIHYITTNIITLIFNKFSNLLLTCHLLELAHDRQIIKFDDVSMFYNNLAVDVEIGMISLL